ncbi:MAG: hypothetical protein ACREOH_11495, partial [Candidatus Entotheonellia bacterium]
MLSMPGELIKDPIFQLNALLWLAQPLPDRQEIIPILYRQGFSVYAVAPLLSLPPDLRLAAQATAISLREGVRHDVILVQQGEQKFAFTECKADSFGPASSTADQARSLLLVSGPRAAEILALAQSQLSSSRLVFVVPEHSRSRLSQTLSSLQSELRADGMPVGEVAIIGLLLTASDLSLSIDSAGSQFFGLAAGTHPFTRVEPDT